MDLHLFAADQCVCGGGPGPLCDLQMVGLRSEVPTMRLHGGVARRAEPFCAAKCVNNLCKRVQCSRNRIELPPALNTVDQEQVAVNQTKSAFKECCCHSPRSHPLTQPHSAGATEQKQPKGVHRWFHHKHSQARSAVNSAWRGAFLRSLRSRLPRVLGHPGLGAFQPLFSSSITSFCLLLAQFQSPAGR